MVHKLFTMTYSRKNKHSSVEAPYKRKKKEQIRYFSYKRCTYSRNQSRLQVWKLQIKEEKLDKKLFVKTLF